MALEICTPVDSHSPRQQTRDELSALAHQADHGCMLGGLSAIVGAPRHGDREVPQLSNRPTLAAYQEYVLELERERGFADEDVLQKCLLLGEEVGELFKAVRKGQGIGVDPGSPVHEIGNEMADILIMLCCVANRLGVDLEQAFREKEKLNAERAWKR